MGEGGTRHRWAHLSMGERTGPQSGQLRRHGHQCHQCGGMFPRWGKPIWRRGLERQCLGVDAESVGGLSLPDGSARAGAARKPTGGSRCTPCVAGRGVRLLPQVRAVCLSLQARPVRPAQGHRVSGGGAPSLLPLLLWTLSLWPLGESRGVYPSGRLSPDIWGWEAIRAIASISSYPKARL